MATPSLRLIIIIIIIIIIMIMIIIIIKIMLDNDNDNNNNFIIVSVRSSLHIRELTTKFKYDCFKYMHVYTHSTVHLLI